MERDDHGAEEEDCRNAGWLWELFVNCGECGGSEYLWLQPLGQCSLDLCRQEGIEFIYS